MANTKISELPVATTIASSVMAGVQDGETRQFPNTLFGGSFSSENTARVDPSGDDLTGQVGDLTKPFLTVQAAITALEASAPYTDSHPAIIRLPTVDTVEDVTTSLTSLVFQGEQGGYVGNPAIGSLTLTSSDPIRVGLSHIYVGDISAPDTDSLNIGLFSSILSADVTCGGSLSILAPYNTGSAQATITCGDGEEIHIAGVVGTPQDFSPPTLNAPNGLIEVFNSIIADVTDADSITLYDSRLLHNTSGVTPTVTDTLLNPALMDFSTLPSTDSGDGIHPWNQGGIVRTSGGTNAVLISRTLTVGNVAQDLSANRTWLGNVPNVDTTNAGNITTGTLPNARLVSIPNSSLSNSNINIAGTATNLGGTISFAGTSGIANADSPASTLNIAVTSGAPTNLVSKTLNISAGDQIRIEAAGAILNNSGGTKLYTLFATIGSLNITIADGTATPSNANNRSTRFIETIVGIKNSSAAWMSGRTTGHTGVALGTGGSLLANLSAAASQQSSSDLTGSQTINVAMYSNVATPTQNFELTAWKIEKIASNP